MPRIRTDFDEMRENAIAEARRRDTRDTHDERAMPEMMSSYDDDEMMSAPMPMMPPRATPRRGYASAMRDDTPRA